MTVAQHALVSRHSVVAGAARAVFRWMILAVVVAILLVTVVVPRVLGAVPLTILTSSMEPTYVPGTLVVARSVDPADLAIGDVVTFQPEPGDPALITHRLQSVVASADATTYITQGDNNAAPDDPLVPEQIKGRVIYSVPYVGRVTNALGVAERETALVIGGALMLGYAAFVVAQAGARRKRP